MKRRTLLQSQAVALSGMRSLGLAALITLASVVPAGARETSRPTPLGNPGEWINPADYPSSALREDAEGVVRFVLGIAADGHVTDCSIQLSSGSQVLDAKTCEILQARALFAPAEDSHGVATVGTWASSVRWQIPNTPRTLPPVVNVSYRFVVEKDGSVSSCEVLSDTEAVRTAAGEQVSPAAQACAKIPDRDFSPLTDSNGQPVRSVTTMTFKTERTQLSD